MNSQIRNCIFPIPVFLQLTFRPLLCTLFWVAGSSFLKGDELEDIRVPDKPPFIDQIGVSIYSGWDSHYFTEGRDLLDGGSLIINDLQSNWEFIFGQIWHTASPDQSYDELQLMIGVAQAIKVCTFYAGHRHIQFPSDDLKDNEVAIGVSVSDLPAEFQITTDIYYSFDADGYFTEIAIFRNFSITESLSINATGIFGINQGYVGDGHDGANHFALTLGLNYQVSDSISIVARLAQSWAIDRDSNAPGDEALVDFSNGGIGVQWSL